MGRQEKWNRLIDAFSGKGTAFSMPEYPKVPFPEMIEKLGALTEEDWGKYAFTRCMEKWFIQRNESERKL